MFRRSPILFLVLPAWAVVGLLAVVIANGRVAAEYGGAAETARGAIDSTIGRTAAPSLLDSADADRPPLRLSAAPDPRRPLHAHSNRISAQ